MSKLDEHTPGNLGGLFEDAAAMPDVHTWDNIATFLVQNNRSIRRRKRILIAAWIGTPVLLAATFGTWFILNQDVKFGIANVMSMDENVTSSQPPQGAAHNLTSTQHVAIGSNTLSSTTGVVATQSATAAQTNTTVSTNNSVDVVLANNFTAPQRRLVANNESIEEDVRLIENKLTVTLPLAASLPANHIVSEPNVKVIEVPEIIVKEASPIKRRNWTLEANLFAQGYSVNEILPQKNVPVESSRTLSNMMLFVPGGGITFQRAVFGRPHQFGTGMLIGYGKRWAFDFRIGYYGVTSEQRTDTVIGYSAIKYARFNSINTYAGARFNFIAKPKFTAYLAAGAGTTSAINNQFELIQYEHSTVVSKEESVQEVQGFKFSGDLGIGIGFKVLPRVSVFAEANVHHTKGEIKHPNVPSFFNNTFLSARTGVQFNLK